MEVTSKNFGDLFKKTAELRAVAEQMQSNPAGLESLKPALKPAVSLLAEQFNTQEAKDTFKKRLLEKISEIYTIEIEEFFKDIELLETLVLK